MNFHEGDNIGSIAICEIAFPFSFSSFNPAVLAIGYTWLSLPLDDQSGSLNLKVSDTDNGPVYTYSGGLKIHNLRESVDNTLYRYVASGAVMRITDMNGRIYIIGAPDEPVTVSLNGGTGEKFADENRQQMQFKIDQAHPAYTS
ncbi:hypothetical protein BDE36_1786 [Arcticibacter tournemirensis]|uniref:Uncharacterized protein n=1 Tax=Arcticibacter tournemirensis TaxID=699437 RepID=A0A5M9HAR2_9SPHI|nr:hypothetical protein [Arcticibacter tournemirensis]KAA8483750.1 hypothetical protein F1649_07630 [Arcticibacter tournemirensis]TQM50051.1 hypothetical protein BDE36_1786 [Arcticibacter tournemirensis]